MDIRARAYEEGMPSRSRMKLNRLGASSLGETGYCLGTMTWGERNAESGCAMSLACGNSRR